MKATNQQESGSNRSREIIGILLFAAALFIFAALFSYDPRDPSLTHYAAGKVTIHNLGGKVGSYFADSIFHFLGIAAYLLPLALAVFSMALFIGKMKAVSLFCVFGYIGIIISIAGLAGAKYPDSKIFGIDAGGFLGKALSVTSQQYLNKAGTYLVFIAIFLISVIATFDISLRSFLRKLKDIVLIFLGRTKNFIAIRIERTRRKRRAAPPRKKASKKDKSVPHIAEEISISSQKSIKSRIEQTSFDFIQKSDKFQLPPLSLLEKVESKDTRMKKESLVMNARLLEKKLSDFGVEGKIVEIRPGPVITMYELEPASGVKINRVTNLSDDLALAMKAQSVRIIAPIPGKAAIGIEIPNQERELVYLRSVLDTEVFLESKYKLPIILGKDIVGNPVAADLVKMPHLLIAGTTGSGKSVSLNAMICSMLFKAGPNEVKFLMIDPKRLELSAYEGIPHLLHPVVVNPKKAAQVLKWAIDEMERRYELISGQGAKSIEKYNRLIEKRKIEDGVPEPGSGQSGESTPPNMSETLPYIVIIIDELADLMMVAQRNVEASLARLAQMARAAGIHIILATQRPSVDVITGIIKANFPTRISFQVSSKVDSRTILDQLGAEKLLGAGDMLFIPPGTSQLVRIHGAFVSDREIKEIVSFLRKQGAPDYDESISEYNTDIKEGATAEDDVDDRYDEAVELVTDLGQASISLVQRYLKIGYNRAARIVERMEAEGVVGPADGSKARKVLAGKLPR
ncbi:MAG: DNA translocase FtsK 4TM domain-containing protein [Syntrophales bacterium]|jgi:S-DNA-T family DNA segregation ATPase FtsK/SpoIIIE|nr:DNA translocase FtsK 4TM domain-containing protein [Syntrophales bacterium]MDY0043423.1 DNA translocase FtsK 4TM domain-containing protein [Syntrophales bacterium]